MRLLDLFCGAGGAAMGYYRAGFKDITGIDNRPMPRYPFKFIQADALEYLEKHGHEYDVIHASPPCKCFTKTGWAIYFNYTRNHLDCLTPTRKLLLNTRSIWIIENVPGAPMRGDFMLCGSQFGLNLRRHRLFELSLSLFDLLPPCRHIKGVASPHGKARKAGELATWGPAMGIDWMDEAGLSQAIPPAYTEWIGRRIMEVMDLKGEEG
jgi:hypothetical protein